MPSCAGVLVGGRTMPWKEGKERAALRKPSKQDVIIILGAVVVGVVVIIAAFLLL